MIRFLGVRPRSIPFAALLVATGCGTGGQGASSSTTDAGSPADVTQGSASAGSDGGAPTGSGAEGGHGDGAASDGTTGDGAANDATRGTGPTDGATDGGPAATDGASDAGALCSPACSGSAQCSGGTCVLCGADGGSCSCIVSCDGLIAGRGDGTIWRYAISSQVQTPTEILGADGKPLLTSSYTDGNAFACAVTGGTVLCWDYAANAVGDLGDGMDAGTTTPTAVVTAPGGPVLSGITQVVANQDGSVVACALDESGGVWCWGSNFTGVLGNGTTDDSTFAVPVLASSGGAHFSGATRIALSTTHACALKGDGTVWCWGKTDGSYGGTPRPYPVQVSSLPSPAVDVAVDDYMTCAVTSDGAVWCWGQAADPSEGYGAATATDVDDPYQLTYLGFDGPEATADMAMPFAGAVTVTAEENAICVLTESGAISCNGGAGFEPAAAGARFLGRGTGLPCFIDANGFHDDGSGMPASTQLSCP